MPRRSNADRLLGWAALFAAVELAAGLVAGFFPLGRAEALIFLAFRPWLMLAAALFGSGAPLRDRFLFYAAILAAAGFGESFLLWSLGGEPWLEMARGWGAGLLAAGVADAAVQAGRRLWGRRGMAAAALLLGAAMLFLGALRPYEAIALGRAERAAPAERPPLLVMTALPLVWGENGPFDPASRPAAAYRALEAEFALRPIDYLDRTSLFGARLLLLAQPRALAPEELVALDAWVRGGGRALILADPDLRWPTTLPPGDVRRAPASTLLGPLLRHWGLALAPPGRASVTDQLAQGGAVRRLALVTPGRFVARGPDCRVGPRDYFADCRIGAGRVRLVADADLLHDLLWTSPSDRGGERHARLADNPLLVADWLDALAGVRRARVAAPVDWIRPGANRASVALAAIPALLLLLAAFSLRARRRG